VWFFFLLYFTNWSVVPGILLETNSDQEDTK